MGETEYIQSVYQVTLYHLATSNSNIHTGSAWNTTDALLQEIQKCSEVTTNTVKRLKPFSNKKLNSKSETWENGFNTAGPKVERMTINSQSGITAY